MPLEAKHVAEGINDLALGSSATMEGTHFKAEQSWSPQNQGFSHGTEFDPLLSEYAASGNHSGMGMQFDPSHTGPPPNTSMTAMPNQGQFSMSPQSQPWMASVAEPFDFSPLAPHSSRQTPVFATSTSIMRRDGIRKKNARFDIPAERNLRTIDQLIAQTSNETEIKELKQQKRLLRNRQAALDSRQRKKQHTERLEEEKKHFTGIINDLEEEQKAQETQWLRRQEEWMQRQSQFQQWIQSLQAEKEQTIQHYSHEVNELRRQNTMLLQQLQKDSATMSQSGSTGMPGEFTDFEQLTIQSSPWDNFSIQNDFSIESDQGPEQGLVKASQAALKKSDKDSPSGLLLMLLLCGAWVISKGSADTKEILPTMPDDLRAASATVIEDLYKGSGIHLPETTAVGHNAASGAIQEQQIRSSGSFDAASNAFGLSSMTAAPGMGAVQQDSFGNPGSAGSAQSMGSILRDAMRSVQGQNPPSADTYTKSLLVDKVPNQILKDFAQMVSKSRIPKRESGLTQHQPTYD